MSKKTKELNLQQAKFCQTYVSKEFFGNGVESYIESYDIDVSKKGAYESAKQCAYKLLTNVDILGRINQLLDGEGLNNEFVDKQLLLVITQNADFSSKVSAIREYNKLKSRIIEKSQITIKKAGLDKADEIYEDK